MEPTMSLFFNGNYLEAMSHDAETLGGEVGVVDRNAKAPDAESRMPGPDHLVMNMTMRLGAATVMASDGPDGMDNTAQGFSVSMSPPEFDRIFEALAKGANCMTMPSGETFWAERFVMFTDRFGMPWMLNYAGSKAANEEISR